MYGGDVQSVLRCGLCNKPFDKQSTLKRHGYYCRSRRVDDTTRSRSCISCAKGKARCDNKRPKCSRCIAKAIECHYPENTRKGTGPRNQHSGYAPTNGRRIEPSLVADSPRVENRLEASNEGNMMLDGELVIPDLEFADLGGEYLDWNSLDIDIADFLNPPTNDETVQYNSLGSSSLVRSSPPPTDRTAQLQENIPPSDVSIPANPTCTVRSLVQRPRMKTGAQGVAGLLLHILKSYSLMMLRHNTLPPFIHPFLLSGDAENNDMEPLTNCISLVRMISSGVQGSRKLFWRNVRLECERLCDEHLRLNKWELLAAMQALFVYILMRLYEGETDHNNYDYLLLATFSVIGTQLRSSYITSNTLAAPCSYSRKTAWRDWIYEESRRRLGVIYRVVDMIFYFEPAAMCSLQKDLVLAPLPAKKQLWEAGDELVWKTERQRGPEVQSAFGLAANGELVELDESQLNCNDAVLSYKSSDTRAPPRANAHWEEWCSGMDGFGGVVMLAASLLV